MVNFLTLPVAHSPFSSKSPNNSGAVCTLGLAIVGIHAHVQRNVMSDPECVPAEVGRPKSKTATSMGLRESAKYLAASPYIRNLAMLVIAYGAYLYRLNMLFCPHEVVDF